MHRPTAEDLEFVLPGMLHQFGNLLLTIQGHASTLEPDRLERAQRAILSATGRATRTLRILHDLGGDSPSTQANAHDLLEQLVDLVRVPVREANQAIALRAAAPRQPVLVQAGPFSRRFLAALRLLLGLLPRAQGGTIETDMSVSVEGCVTVHLRHEPMAGALPFPIPTRDLLEALERACPGTAAWCKCPSQGAGVDLLFPAGVASHESQA